MGSGGVGFPLLGRGMSKFSTSGGDFYSHSPSRESPGGWGGGTLLLPPMHLTLNLASEIDM